MDTPDESSAVSPRMSQADSAPPTASIPTPKQPAPAVAEGMPISMSAPATEMPSLERVISRRCCLHNGSPSWRKLQCKSIVGFCSALEGDHVTILPPYLDCCALSNIAFKWASLTIKSVGAEGQATQKPLAKFARVDDPGGGAAGNGSSRSQHHAGRNPGP